MTSGNAAEMTRFTEIGQRILSLVRHPLFWVALAALPLQSAHLGGPGLHDGEAMYAEIPREMRVDGTWITPRLNGSRHFDKPPLIYWMIGITQHLLGETEAAARLWSVLASCATIVLVGALGRTLYGERAGWISALIYATSLGPYIFGGQALTDPLLIFLIALAILGYLRGYVFPKDSNSLWPWLMYGSLGLSLLTKGIVGLGLPTAVIGSHVLLSGRLREFFSWRLFAGLGVAAIIAVPWFVAVASTNPDFLDYIFIHEHLQRFTGERFPRHEFLSLPVFLTLTLIWTFPWVPMVPQALKCAAQRLRRSGLRQSTDLLPLLWLTIVIGLFSASSSRLEYYSLPAIPAFALLLGKLWGELLEDGPDRPSLRGSLIGFGIMSVIMVSAALASYVILGPGKNLVFQAVASSWPTAGWTGGAEQVVALDRIRIPTLAAMAGAGIFTTAALVALFRSRPGVACGLLAVMMVPLFLAVQWGFMVMEPFMSARPLAEIVRRNAGPEDIIVTEEPPEYMWIGGITYYTKRMVYVLKNPEYAGIPPQHREPAARFLDWSGFEALWKSGRRVLMVTDLEKKADFEALLLRAGPVRIVGQCARGVVFGNSSEY